MDVVSAYTEVHGICEVLKQVRADADEEFHSVFKEMESMADIADKPISIPLRCGKRTLCNNVEADDAETYYRRTIFLSFLDGMIAQLAVRFPSLNAQATRGLLLIPTNLEQMSKENGRSIEEYYGPDMPSAPTFHQEIRLWRHNWSSYVNKPTTLQDTLTQCNAK